MTLSNTIDLEVCTSLDDDDREYYGNSDHLVYERPEDFVTQTERKMLEQAGLTI